MWRVTACGLFLASLPLLPGTVGTTATEADPYKLKGYPTYVRQCAPCHGEHGDGAGAGARFLQPPPRDFRRTPLKWASTDNGVASIDDIRRSIVEGVGGTAMIPFRHLGDGACNDLADVVAAFRARGARETASEAGLSGDDLERAVLARTTAGAKIAAPPVDASDGDAVARGYVAYHRRGCAACHGPDARGGDYESEVDGRRVRTRIPDPTTGLLRRSRSPDDLAARIRAGIPGTAMPATPMPDAELGDLIRWLRDRIPATASAFSTPWSGSLPAVRFDGVLPTSPDDPRFDAAPQTWLPLAPFDAFHHPTRGVRVAALASATHVVLRVLVPDAGRDPVDGGPPDGVAVRATLAPKPPVLPFPGQMPVLDRAVTYTGPMPRARDPIFDVSGFENPEEVCRTIAPAARTGDSVYASGMWRHVIALRTEQSGTPLGPTPLSIAVAIFDGSARKGPLPTAFTAWMELIVAPEGR